MDEKGLSKILYMDGKGLGKILNMDQKGLDKLRKILTIYTQYQIIIWTRKGWKKIKYGPEMVQKGLSNKY